MKTFQKRAMVAMFSGLALAAVACKKDDPNAQSAANANGQYPPQQQQYPQQQQQYPDQQQQQQQYPQQQQQQPATGTLATPGPLALPCSADSACLLHKCNTAAGKCAFPCASDFDCNPGNKCNPGVGACFPG